MSDDSDAKGADEETSQLIRSYHPHPRPEFYTTLEAANRAAHSLQIELSHEKDPRDVMTKTFQEKNLTERMQKFSSWNCQQMMRMDAGRVSSTLPV
jgi:hypothetical protein